MISYSQNAEDVRLSRVFTNSSGFYIDIGACHPTIDSVTRIFYERSWRGINLEPIERLHQKLKLQRPNDINLLAAVSDQNGQQELKIFPQSLPYSTLENNFPNAMTNKGALVQTVDVQTITLHSIFEQYVGEQTVDFLKIDVEGHEHAVLRGNDWKKNRPRVVVVESIDPQSHQPNHEQWESILLESSYQFAVFDGLNRFYLREEDSQFFETLAKPICIHDKFVTLTQIAQVRWLNDKLQQIRASPTPQAGLDQFQRFFEHFESSPLSLLDQPPQWEAQWEQLKPRLPVAGPR